MRKAVLMLLVQLFVNLPVQAESHDTIHLWSEAAPGPVLLYNETGVLTAVEADQPIDLHLAAEGWTLVRLIDGVPQADSLVFGEDTNASSFLSTEIEAPLAISGAAHLDLEGPIAAQQSLNATWNATVSIPTTLGHPDLPGAHLGILHQLEAEFNSDLGNFTAWLVNTTSVGCCTYDHAAMQVIDPVLTPFGGITHWGWNLTANLTGAADARSTRLLEVPVTGRLGDAVPLRITMPAPHEIRYSPQEEHISGVPDDFILARGAIGVTGNVTIALGTNAAPSADFLRTDGELPYLPAGRPSTIQAACTDTSISDPAPRFILSEGENVLFDENSSVVPIDPMYLGLAPSTTVNLSLTCTDPQGLVANHSRELYIDGSPPTRILQMAYLHPDDAEPTDLDHGQSDITVPSGATLSAATQAGDDAPVPVAIEWTSDKSAGWRHVGSGSHAWNDLFVQGAHVNGQHLSREDRHQAKPLTTYALQLNLTDAAGNDVIQQWTVTVEDRTAPRPRPALSVDGQHYGDLNQPVQGGSPVVVDLNESWDDIDAITTLTWVADLNGAPLDIGTTWEEVRTFTLPNLPTGRHVLMVNATDGSGNQGSHGLTIVVQPPLAADYRVTEVTKVGEGGPGEPGALDITLENHGQEPLQLVICYIEACTLELVGVQATEDGPGRLTHRLPVKEWAVGEVRIEVHFSNNTTMTHDTGIHIQSEMTPLMWILLSMPLIIGFIAFQRMKRQPEEESP